MKNNYQRAFLRSAVITALAGSITYAGPVEMTMPAQAPSPAEDVISGSLNLDFSSHFFSYGNDVWNDGSDAFDMGFYPSAELNAALPFGLTATAGIWAELHDKTGTGTTIGGDINEVDLYYGLSYTYEKFTIGVTYQNWFYAGDVEDILDVSLAYDGFLSPSLTIHNRLTPGGARSLNDDGTPNATGDTGTIIVLGLEYGIEAGPVSITFPFSLAYFVEDGYHQAGADSGLGYGSIGVSASVPLTSVIGDAFGDWSLHAGVTYYVTDDQVVGVGVNPEDSFVATNIGLSLSF